MTFLQALNTFSDRTLERAVGAVDAGACVPSHGKFCACSYIPFTRCYDVGLPNYLVIGCHGICSGASNSCCG